MLSLFIPANTSFGLALLLVPIEFVSYIFKPISLGVRLFANLMAGHTLLKVIAGFSWSMLLLENYLSIEHLVPSPYYEISSTAYALDANILVNKKSKKE